jgi:hypothetical protein
VFRSSAKGSKRSRYWLRIIVRKWKDAVDTTADIEEATEITHILTAIIEKLK